MTTIILRIRNTRPTSKDPTRGQNAYWTQEDVKARHDLDLKNSQEHTDVAATGNLCRICLKIQVDIQLQYKDARDNNWYSGGSSTLAEG